MVTVRWQLELSGGSTGLDLQGVSLIWLAVNGDCRLGAQWGTDWGTCKGPLHMTWVSRAWSLGSKREQDTQVQAAGLLTTLPQSVISEHHSAALQ